MSNWAEIIIVKEVQKESKIKQEKIALQNKIAQEKKHEANTSAMQHFLNRYIDNEWFWKLIAYGYFVGKTLGLFILIDVFIFGRPTMILFAFTFLCFSYLDLKLYKLYLGKRLKDSRDLCVPLDDYVRNYFSANPL